MTAPEAHRTKTGRVLTDADIEQLADEAERGYDVSKLVGRRVRPLCAPQAAQLAVELPPWPTPWPTDLVLHWAGAEKYGAMALLSLCERYRYLLVRTWNPCRPRATWIMLNPSTADHVVDDATISKCMRYARTWGCGGIVVANLFAYRARDPRELARAADPVGPHNDAVLRHLAAGMFAGGPWLAGWGANKAVGQRGAQVAEMLASAGVELRCLTVTRDGQPGHPLYVRGDASPLPYPGSPAARKDC